MRKRIPFLRILVDAVLIACGMLAAVCSVPSAYGAPFEISTLALASAPVALLVSSALHIGKKRWFIPLLLLAAIAVYGYVDREAIANGAKLVWYLLMSPLSIDFSFLPVPAEPAELLFPAACVTSFLIFAASIFALLIGLALIKCKSPVPAILIPLPTFLLGLIYTDCVPALFAAVLLMIYWGGVLLGRELIKSDSEKAGISKALLLLLLIGAAMSVLVISPKSAYKPIPLAEMRGMISKRISEIQDSLLSRYSSNPKEYDLTQEDDRFLSEDKAFMIKATRTGTFLLRTHSYGRYSRNRWLAAAEYTGGWRSMHALGATQSGEYEVLYIRDAYTNERIVPYAFLQDDPFIVNESFVRSNGRTAYLWTFRPEIRFVPRLRSETESEYYRFALKEYTLPDGTERAMLLNILSEAGLLSRVKTMQLEDQYQAALMVAEYVSGQGLYTFTPGKVPGNKDFIEYFLTKNHMGYCVHFASSTTALLQAVGIPARYVIGYRVTVPEEETWITVAKKTSHAWTEIYLRGVGWVPIESTAGFQRYTGYAPENAPDPFVPEETPRPPVGPVTDDPIDETPLPLDTPRPTRNPDASPSATPSPTPKPGGAGTDPGGTKRGGKPWWLLAIPGAIALWEGVGVLIRRRRRRAFAQEDSKTAVLLMLRYLEGLEIHGAQPVENAEALANEAAFSNHPMAEKQKVLQRKVRREQMTIYSYKPFKRFIYRWVLFRL